MTSSDASHSGRGQPQEQRWTTRRRPASQAFFAGLNGGLAMMVLLALLPQQQLPHHLGLILGTLVVGEVSLGAWAIGLVMHLCIGGLLGILYAIIFARLLHRAGWLAGLATAGVHSLLAGPALALLPLLHPLVPTALPAPGMWLSKMGPLAALAFFAAHLLFGVIVGGICGDLPASAATTGGERPAPSEPKQVFQ